MQAPQVAPTTDNNHFGLGVLFVALGSASYGMLSTVVKLAYEKNFTTGEVVTSQFLWGVLCLWVLNLVFSKRNDRPTRRDVWNLMWAGAPLGLTGIFYYSCVRDISASIGVVLLMQSVWMGVVVESVQSRRRPGALKMIGVILVLAGTVLATDALSGDHHLSVMGVVFGLLSAVSYTWTLFASSSVGAHLTSLQRSQHMVRGGAVLALLFLFVFQALPYALQTPSPVDGLIPNRVFSFDIVFTYGLFVALFGTVIPPLMLNRGFPVVGVGLGSIISSIELPCAVLMAYLLLGETVNALQGLGIFLILAAIFILNFKLIAPQKRTTA